ncbi:MAG TPA: hypothetical protein VG777_05500 [Thermoanaerobaculia bacterium]|nr:hypothetical protein [Thermoanaerobaculia bacterium]
MTVSLPKITSGGLRLAVFFAAAAAAASGCRRQRPDVRIVRESTPSEAPPAAPGASPIPREVALGPAETKAVRDYLASRPGWRLASDTDARPSDDADDMAPLYGVYHPYFVRGDLDDDGRLDFVAAFVDGGKPAASPWFTVVAFLADGRGGFRPQAIESEISLERGDLSVDRDAVVVTTDLAEDDTTRRYRWNTGRKRFEFVSGDDDSSPGRAPSTRV